MKYYKNLTRLLCCLLCLCLCLSACKRRSESTTTAPKDPTKDVIYTVTLKTAGGMVLPNVSVYVYEDATEDNLLTYGNMDNNGAFTFTAQESDKYTVRFGGLPKEGYDVQPYYPVTSQNTDIVLTSSVVTGLDALEEGKSYGLGDVMRDFTVTTVDGEELTLSGLLEEKEAVVLNFWYTGCGPCKNEFSLLQTAYKAYSDKIEVITMNPTDISRDTVEGIKAYRDENGLTMPMAVCSGQWFGALGINAYPTTVIIDRYGVVCLITGTVEEPGVFESIFAHFAAENYEQKLVEDISELHIVEYAEGHPKNPYQTYGAVGQFEVTVPAGSEYYVLIYKADGFTLRIEDPNVYVRYGEARYTPDANGVIEVVIDNPDMMAGASVVIANTGATDSTVAVRLLIPQGTSTTPYEAQLGNVTVNIAEGNEQGVHYSWIATGNGILTLTITDAPENKFDVQLYNTTTMAVRNLGEEPLVDENGNRYVCVEVRAGDEVRIGYLTAPDADGNYPAATIKAELSLSQGEEQVTEYCVTVVDESGNPVKDVTVSIVINGAQTRFKTDEEGKVVVTLSDDTYTVVVTAPEGYTCETTQFLLSGTNSTKEVVLKRIVVQPVTYTVYVKDETGAPVENAIVILNGVSYYTDDQGAFSFELLKSDSYGVTVVAPEGYTLENGEFAFGTETTITVTVYRKVEEKTEYKVYVKDQDGKAVTNVQVRLDAEDSSVSVTKAVDANGCATFELPDNDYIATIVFNGTPMGYEPTITRLTPDKTSLTVELVPYLNGATEDLYTGDVACYLETGSFYVDLTNADIRYFLFAPTESGIYTFTTTNPDAAVGYWGSLSAIFDASSNENIKNNVWTMEVTDGQNYLLSVSGGAGITGTVVKITRVGDPKPSVEYVVHKGTATPTETFVANETGTKTYVDISVEQTLVKGEDGFYHLGAADGPIVYMDLKGTRYNISIAALINASPMCMYEYNSKGEPIRRIDYTECMRSYVTYADKQLGVYVLTDDLKIIMQNHGNDVGWYQRGGPSYLFNQDPVDETSAWMFLLCTFQ